MKKNSKLTLKGATPLTKDEMKQVLGGNTFGPGPTCDTYYHYVGGYGVLGECPPGLEWAQHLYRCDWPEVAQCNKKDRPLSEREQACVGKNLGDRCSWFGSYGQLVSGTCSQFFTNEYLYCSNLNTHW